MRNHIVTSRLNPFILSAIPQLRFKPDPPADPPAGGTPPPPVTPPAAVTPPTGHAPNGQFTQDHLNERIAQAKRSERAAAEKEFLDKLGAKDLDTASKAMAKAKEIEEAAKTDSQRKDEELTTAKAKALEADSYRTILTDRANKELALLPQAAQDSIKALAGDDPAKLLSAIDLAKAMGTGTPPPAAKPALPPAANTTGAAGGPPSAAGSPPDLMAEWRTMQKQNPLAAAHFFLAHQAAIVAQMNAQPT